MTYNRSVRTVLTTLVIVSVLVGAIAGPILAPSSEAQPATTGENSTTASINADSNADTTTNAPVTGVTNTNTNTNANDLTNTNTNTNTNRANATAGARSTGSSLDLGNGGNGSNGTNGCTLPSPDASFEEFQKLLPDDGEADDEFGRSVAVDRATETIVVGAPLDNNANGEDAGAVYVFSCQGDQFVQTQKLTANDGEADDEFGWSVAIDGDSIVVGAPSAANESGVSTGAGYVFERQGGQFLQTQKLTASDGQAGDQFGTSVAIDGDTIAVGAFFDENEIGDDAGAAYVYERQGGSFGETQKLLASDGRRFDRFGWSVAIDGDTIVVGAQDGAIRGAAYVFERQGGSFVEIQKLTASDGGAFDFFGFSVAIDGETIVVGASREDENGTDAGAAYVYERQGGSFGETQKILASDGAANDRFGTSVAIDGDTIVSGAPFEDENETDVGAAYVFERQGGSFVETQKLTTSDGQAGNQFGWSVAIDGWIVGGAPLEDENGDDAGAAYVFD